MEKTYNEVIKEEVYFEKLENGLEVFFIPKKGFASKYAILGTNFGSNDLEFIPIDENKKIKVSEGIAHFLEHKMFEQPDGNNAFDEFSKFGASANAFTSFNMTAYLFNTTNNFYGSLEHLIKYVQTPYYTDENVNKEKGIIAQEIKMYQDDPSWNVYFNCLKAMYSKHYLSVDIAGSVESINEITKEELYKCYNTFYNPENMVLVIVGDLEVDKLMETIKKSNNPSINHTEKITRFMPEEPLEVNAKRIEEKYPISVSMFYIGYKDNSIKDILKNAEKSKKDIDDLVLKNEISSEIMFDMIFSESGNLSSKLYNDGIIYDTLDGGYICQKDYAYAIVSGVTNDPDLVKEKIDKYIENLKSENITKEEFLRYKKKKIGEFLKLFDSITQIGRNFLSYRFRNIDLLNYLDILKKVEFEEVEKKLYNLFDEKNSVISIIKPLDNKNDSEK